MLILLVGLLSGLTSQNIFFEDFEDNNTPQMQYCDNPGEALNNNYVQYWTPYNLYPGYMDIRCTDTCILYTPVKDAYSGNNAMEISANGNNLHYNNQGNCDDARPLGSGICYFNSNSNDPNRLYFGIGQWYVVSFKSRFNFINELRPDADKLIVGYRVEDEEIPVNNNDTCKFIRFADYYKPYSGIVQVANDTLWHSDTAMLKNDYIPEDEDEDPSTAYQLIIKTKLCNSDCSSITVPHFFIDDVSVKCDPDEIFVEIKEKTDEIFDEAACKMSREYSVGAYYNCIIDFDKLNYTVEVIDNNGDIINSFNTSGETFTVDYDIFAAYPLKIRVSSIVNDTDEKKYYFINPDEDKDILYEDFDYWDEDFVNGIQENNGNDIIIHPGQDIVWDNSYKPYEIVAKNIYIERGGKLTIKNRVFLSPESHIVVEKGNERFSGGELLVDGGHLGSDYCNWQGIIVKGHSDDDSQANAGKVYTMNGAIIENAHIGISTNYFGQWTDQDWGGVVQCDDTEFRNCWKGIEFMKYEYENKSYVSHCDFTGENTGISIWACKGIDILNGCTFDGFTWGMNSIDAEYNVEYGNVFSNCERGVLATTETPGASKIQIKSNNIFEDNWFAGVELSGNTFSHIESNSFLFNWRGVLLDEENECNIQNNNFNTHAYGVISRQTGTGYNETNCNDMYGTLYDGIYYTGENSNSRFLSNTFVATGLGGMTTDPHDITGYNTTVKDNIGGINQPANNYFSGITNDMYWTNCNPFKYWILEYNPPAETVPNNQNNYQAWHHSQGVSDMVRCEEVDDSISYTASMAAMVGDYNAALAQYKSNPLDESKRQEYREIESGIGQIYSKWLQAKEESDDLTTIEQVLKSLNGDYWKVKLYSFYVRHSMYVQAESVLNELQYSPVVPTVAEELQAENRECILAVQRINLKIQQSNGAYKPTAMEMNTLKEEAMRDLPESAYAKGVYFFVTGEYLETDMPGIINQGDIQLREAKETVKTWTIYPNPTDNSLYIDYNSKSKIKGKVCIYDLIGSKVMEKNVNFVQGVKTSINVSGLQSGVYILTIQDGDKKILKTQKVMINSVK